MTRFTMGMRPVLPGYGQAMREPKAASRAGKDGYPPFDVVMLDEDHYRITLAVAGFGEDELEVVIENGELLIRGAQEKGDEGKRIFLHRGIATRRFMKRFALGENVEVRSARLENGLLHVDLERVRPESVQKRIAIRRG